MRSRRPTSTPATTPRPPRFLRWLADDNFTFLGYRGPDGTGLGILREQEEEDPAEGLSRDAGLLTLTKANTRSTVHRAAYLDFVGRRGPLLPRPVHPHRLRREPRRHPGPAPPRGLGARPRGVPAGQPQREGAARDPRHLPARRAIPDLGARAVRGRDGHPPPRRAPATAAVRAPRLVRPLLLAARVRAARPLQHREPPPHRGDPADGDRRQAIDYTTRVSESVLVRLHFVAYVEPGGGCRLRPARGRDDARGGHALVVRRSRGRALRRARRGARRRALPALRRRVPRGVPRRLGGALGARGHRPRRGAARVRRARHHALPAARGGGRGCCARSCSAPAGR